MLAASIACGVHCAKAGETSASDLCPSAASTATVAHILDARALELADGRRILLAFLDLSPEGGPLPASLKELSGSEIGIVPADAAPDRYGRWPMLVYAGGNLIQTALLKNGEARVTGLVSGRAAAHSLTPCLRNLLASEKEARSKGVGLWKNISAIKNAESSGDIWANVGRFALIEGTVRSVRLSRGTIYINFSKRWSRGFSATVFRRQRAQIEKNGFTLKSLENRKIRVRGWIVRRTGLQMPLLTREQIELID